MARLAVLGCGRIGAMHAANIAAHPRAELTGVYDIAAAAAGNVGRTLGARIFRSPEEVFASPDVDAVLVATATATHCDYIEAAVEAGKPVLCEKPLDLSLERVELCRSRIGDTNLPIMLGFVRRFDAGHRAARQALSGRRDRRPPSGDHHVAGPGPVVGRLYRGFGAASSAT